MKIQKQFAAAQDEVQFSLSESCSEDLLVQIIGAGTLTVVLEISLDGGTTWTAARLRDLATGTDAASETANGTYRPTDPIYGATSARLRCSAYTSGNKTVYASAVRAAA